MRNADDSAAPLFAESQACLCRKQIDFKIAALKTAYGAIRQT
jgi:hypothetical protein